MISKRQLEILTTRSRLVPNQLLLLSTALCPILDMFILRLPLLLLQLGCQFSALLSSSVTSLLAEYISFVRWEPL